MPGGWSVGRLEGAGGPGGSEPEAENVTSCDVIQGPDTAADDNTSADNDTKAPVLQTPTNEEAKTSEDAKAADAANAAGVPGDAMRARPQGLDASASEANTPAADHRKAAEAAKSAEVDEGAKAAEDPIAAKGASSAKEAKAAGVAAEAGTSANAGDDSHEANGAHDDDGPPERSPGEHADDDPSWYRRQLAFLKLKIREVGEMNELLKELGGPAEDVKNATYGLTRLGLSLYVRT